MTTSHIGSITGQVINFIKTKLSFLASILMNYGRFAYCLFAYVLGRFAYIQYVSSNLCKNI